MLLRKCFLLFPPATSSSPEEGAGAPKEALGFASDQKPAHSISLGVITYLESPSERVPSREKRIARPFAEVHETEGRGHWRVGFLVVSV